MITRLLRTAVVLSLLLLAACGGSASTSSPTTGAAGSGAAASAGAITPTASQKTAAPSPSESAPAFPVSVEAANGEVTLDTRPQRIVSLAPTATEMLFAIDAGEQVIAVDDQSDYPPSAPVTDLSGLEPNIEAIAGYEPDLVVISYDPGELASGLEALEIPVALLPAATAITDTYAQLEQLGVLTGHVADAAAVVTRMQTEMEELARNAPTEGEPLSYYHELDDTYYTVTSETFIGDVYDRLGLVNIADAADKQGTGYPQLSAEYIIEADPDLIFLGDTECCGVTAQTVASRPGWQNITAVRRGAIVELDDDVTSRWGPRVVEFLRAANTAVEAAKTGADVGS